MSERSSETPTPRRNWLARNRPKTPSEWTLAVSLIIELWAGFTLLTLSVGVLIPHQPLASLDFLSQANLLDGLIGLAATVVGVTMLFRADHHAPIWPRWYQELRAPSQTVASSIGLSQIGFGLFWLSMPVSHYLAKPYISPISLWLPLGAIVALPAFLLLWWAIPRLSRLVWLRLAEPRTRARRSERGASVANGGAQPSLTTVAADATPRVTRRTLVLGAGVLAVDVGVIGALLVRLPSMLTRYTFRGPSALVAWAPAGQRIASAGDGGAVVVWDALTGATVRQFHCAGTGPYDSATGLAWSPDGQRLIATYSLLNNRVGEVATQLWDVATGQTLATLALPIIGGAAWQPHGQNVLVSADDGLRLWNSAIGASKLLVPNKNDVIAAVTWSPDGKYVATWIYSVVSIWDAQTGVRAYHYTNDIRQTDAGTTNEIGPLTSQSFAWSPDGLRIAAGCQDNTLLVWDALTGANVKSYRGPLIDPSNQYAFYGTNVQSVAWSPDSAYVAAGGDDQTVRVWRVAGAGDQHAPAFIWNGHFDTVTSVSWSPDGSLIASSDGNETQVWRPQGDSWW